MNTRTGSAGSESFPTIAAAIDAERQRLVDRRGDYLAKACRDVAARVVDSAGLDTPPSPDAKERMLADERGKIEQELGEYRSIAARFGIFTYPGYLGAITDYALDLVTDIDVVKGLDLGMTDPFILQQRGLRDLAADYDVRSDFRIAQGVDPRNPRLRNVQTDEGVLVVTDDERVIRRYQHPNSGRLLTITRQIVTVPATGAPGNVRWGKNVSRDPFNEPRPDIADSTQRFLGSAAWVSAREIEA